MAGPKTYIIKLFWLLYVDCQLDQYATAFLCGAITHRALCWFKAEKPVAQEQLSELLYCILTGNYFQMRNEYLE